MAYRFALQRPTVLMVIMAIVCLFGLASLMRVPIQLIPDLDPRIVTVQTVWPGANPQDVEREILIEQEEFLRNVPGLERMISTSSFGQGSIELEFPFGMDINEALIRTSNALSQVPRYPENVDEPRISTESMSQNAFAFYSIMPLPGNPQGVRIREETDWLGGSPAEVCRFANIAGSESGFRWQHGDSADPARALDDALDRALTWMERCAKSHGHGQSYDHHAVFGVLAWLVAWELVNELLWENEYLEANPWLFPAICLPFSLLVGLLIKYRQAPTTLDEGLYHADGQILDEVYVYGSFLQSRMAHAGVRCSNCHDPHTARPVLAGNAVCTQCHNPAMLGGEVGGEMGPIRIMRGADHEHDLQMVCGELKAWWPSAPHMDEP